MYSNTEKSNDSKNELVGSSLTKGITKSTTGYKITDNRSDFRKLAKLQGKMNSVLNPNRSIQLQARSTGVIDNKQTDVDWKTGKLFGDIVGVEMCAKILGPDHLQGTPPKSGVQKSLMRILPTDPTLTNEKKYIRGHLLNDNLGGMGEDYNLYPITANANKQHHDLIERPVKEWVNNSKQWVYYHVKVENHANPLDCQFNCEAQILDPGDLKPKGEKVSALIHSKYDQDMTASNKQISDKASGRFAIGPQAKDHNVLLSKAKKLSNIKIEGSDVDVVESLEFLFSTYPNETKAELLKIKGIGPVSVELLSEICSDHVNEIGKKEHSAFQKLKIKETDLLAYIAGLFVKFESE